MWRRETSQFFLKQILAVHFVIMLFQRHICDYCCFQVVIKTREKQTWRRETLQFFLNYTLAVHFVKILLQCDICDYLCFQVVIKTHEKQKRRRETSQLFLKHKLAVHFVKTLFQCTEVGREFLMYFGFWDFLALDNVFMPNQRCSQLKT